jgi:chemotaxis receptor (MCP) glutamine deamidase CheD
MDWAMKAAAQGDQSLSLQPPTDNLSLTTSLGRITDQSLCPNDLPFIKDDPDMHEVFMGGYWSTRADSSQPIIKTLRLRTCTGIVLYHPEKKIAGVIHENTGDDQIRHEKVNKLLNRMYSQGLTEAGIETLQASIFGGRALQLAKEQEPDEEYTYYDRLSSTEACLRNYGINNILYKETEDTEQNEGRSIAIDSRTGQIYNLIDIDWDAQERKLFGV